MAALTTLARIKAIAQQDAYIQGLSADSDAVVMVLEDVALHVTESVFGSYTEIAQRYLAAHFLSAAGQAAGGQGPLSSESLGGVSQSFTLPYLNRQTVLGMTQYGNQYLEYERKCIVPFRVVMP